MRLQRLSIEISKVPPPLCEKSNQVAANMLLNLEGSAKLCDFGVSAHLDYQQRRTSIQGTPYYMAPELIKGDPYDYMADIWSLGITFIELATGNPPHLNKRGQDILNAIISSKPPRLDEKKFSEPLRNLVASCLEEDPNMVRDLLSVQGV